MQGLTKSPGKSLAFIKAEAEELARSEKSKRLDEQAMLARDNLLFYLTEFVWTLNIDEMDPLDKGKWERYPNVYYKDRSDYRDDLALLLEVWQTERFILIPKSRQMLMTWTMVAAHLWRAQCKKDEIIFFQTLKEDKAGFKISNQSLLSRAEGILERQPHNLGLTSFSNGKTYKKQLKPPVIEFSNGSIMFGISQDSEDPRSYSTSAIFADEVAFQNKAAEAFGAAKFTLGSFGKYTGISTVYHHDPFFYHRCFSLDREVIPGHNATDLVVNGKYRRCEGMEVKQQTNDFVTIRYHYTANPAKRDPQWIENAKRAADPVDWEQEMEINWDVSKGAAYFSKFNAERHVAEVEIDAVAGIPVFRGWDFGFQFPGSVMAQIYNGTLMILKEYHEPNQETYDFISNALIYSRKMFPHAIFRDTCDANGTQRLKTKLTDVEIMKSLGLRPTYKWVRDDEYTLGLIRQYFNMETGDKPGVIINPSCQLMIEGFRTELRYPNVYAGSQRKNLLPIEKHPFIDILDALKYIVYNFGGKILDPNLGMPSEVELRSRNFGAVKVSQPRRDFMAM